MLAKKNSMSNILFGDHGKGVDHRRKSDRRMSRCGSLMQMILWIVSLPFGPWFKQCRCSYSCHAKNWSSYDFWWSLELLTNDQHGSLLSLMTAKYRWSNVCYWIPSCLILYWRPSLSLSPPLESFNNPVLAWGPWQRSGEPLHHLSSVFMYLSMV